MNKGLEEKLKQLPRRSGVYFHKAKNGEVIYVGKAAVLRNRVRQYFQNTKLFDAKTMALTNEIYDTDWLETESEIDALFLESEMIKRYMPRYNVLLRDDKSQNFVRIDMKSEWPTVTFTRNPGDDGAEYFGPFYNGLALKKALRYLRKVYPYFVKPYDKKGSKLEAQIGLNPDVHEGSATYKLNLKKLSSYIRGHRKVLMDELEKDMKRSAAVQDFEMAAKLRNRLHYMNELQRRVMFGDREFLDISKDRALSDLGKILGIKRPLRRIEGYDVSHHGGMNVVASMVVFANGVSDRSEYRKFKMTKQRNDDAGSIYEAIFRRFSDKNKSWGVPDLIIIDGGKAQLESAIKAMRNRNIQIPVFSIMKRDEEILLAKSGSHVATDITKEIVKNKIGVAVYEDEKYLTLNLHSGQQNAGSHSKNLRGSEVVAEYSDVTKLLQRLRDESHRFAVSYHTALKRTNSTRSILEDIPGIGPATRKKLLRTFGSMRALKNVSEEEVANIVGSDKASRIVQAIQ